MPKDLLSTSTSPKSRSHRPRLVTKTSRNMASLCKITLNLARLAQNRQPKKVSLKNIHNLAAWDCALRDSVLGLA